MKSYKIPNLKEILKPRWAHKPGWGMKAEYTLKYRPTLEQSTTPKDPRLLEKLGIKKGEKVLGIACYYASWAAELKRKGAKVDYSDISRSLVNWAKRNYRNLFGKYICSNYELIPKSAGEYDWTFTYEACGGDSGLPIAYLRSLLNSKGGILVMHWRPDEPEKMGGKPKTYPRIVKTLSKLYHAKSSVRNIRIRGHRMGETQVRPLTYFVYTVRTNERARELATQDLEALMSNKFSKDNLERLSRLPIKEEFLKEVRIN